LTKNQEEGSGAGAALPQREERDCGVHKEIHATMKRRGVREHPMQSKQDGPQLERIDVLRVTPGGGDDGGPAAGEDIGVEGLKPPLCLDELHAFNRREGKPRGDKGICVSVTPKKGLQHCVATIGAQRPVETIVRGGHGSADNTSAGFGSISGNDARKDRGAEVALKQRQETQ
jgi:hypothetical protein